MKSTRKIHHATGGALVHGDKCCIFRVIAYNSKASSISCQKREKRNPGSSLMYVFDHMWNEGSRYPGRYVIQEVGVKQCRRLKEKP